MTDALFPRAFGQPPNLSRLPNAPGGRPFDRLRGRSGSVDDALPGRPAAVAAQLGGDRNDQAALQTTPPPRPSRFGARAGRALRPAPGPGPRSLQHGKTGPSGQNEPGDDNRPTGVAGDVAPDAPSGHGDAGRPRPHAAPRPSPHTGQPGAETPPTDPADLADTTATDPTPDPEQVELEHAETWRLVRLAQAGDGDAFGLLYDRYVDAVFRFIFFRVNDRALAEDFTSETFLRALRRIGSISYQGRDIGAWFITIARNIVLDHLKSARHRLEMTTADTIEGREHVASTETAVLETLQSERLMAAVNELGAEQRQCITLRFIQGLSVSETAAVMGKNDGAIKALQHRAVRKLADLVGQELR